jgi:hypothetical protein
MKNVVEVVMLDRACPTASTAIQRTTRSGQRDGDRTDRVHDLSKEVKMGNRDG